MNTSTLLFPTLRVFTSRADQGFGAPRGRARILALAALVALPLALGCDDDPAPSTPPAPGPAPTPEREGADDYEVIELEDGGSIAGTVRWTGPVPEPTALPVRVHAEACGASQPSQALVVSERGRVTNAVVALVGVRRGRALDPPETPPTLTQSGCRLVPHVVAVGVGWPITLTNEDPVMHNVRGRVGDRTVLDVGLPERGASVTRRLDAPGVVRVLCDVGHTWQQAWIHAYEHPYFAVTDETGSYRLDRVPPGRYTLRLWHEGWRVVGTEAGRPAYSSPVVLTRSVSVSPRQETRVDFELSQQAAEIAGE